MLKRARNFLKTFSRSRTQSTTKREILEYQKSTSQDAIATDLEFRKLSLIVMLECESRRSLAILPNNICKDDLTNCISTNVRS